MHLTVPVYEQLRRRYATLFTLGLGQHSRTEGARSPVKARRTLARALRKSLSALRPTALIGLAPSPGMRLHKLHVELTLRDDFGKRSVAGRIPLVCVPRWLSSQQRMIVAYHPKHQGLWFPCDLEQPLEPQARRWLQRALRNCTDETLEGLWCEGRDRIRLLGVAFEPKSLLDQLPGRADADRPLVGAGGRRPRPRGGVQTVPEIATDETQYAIDGELPGGTPRTPYRERLVELLGGRRRRSVLVIGRPGVGKTTLVHRHTIDLLAHDGYWTHLNRARCTTVWRTTGRRIIAGMTHLGQWEERCFGILEDARRQPMILAVDDIHAFGRLGRSAESDRCLADVFRGPIARGELCVVGECTPEQAQRLEDDAPAFYSGFVRVLVEEPPGAAVLSLLLGAARELQGQYGRAVRPDALRAVLELSDRLLVASAFPGKAVQLLSDAMREPTPAGGSAAEPEPRRVDVAAILRVAHERTGIGEALLRPEQPVRAEDVEAAFGRQVMGQEGAVRACRDVVLRMKAGLCDARRPAAVYLFTGPTGTGKTELARCLAEYLYGSERRLVRIDMGELSGPDAPARLIGDSYRPEDGLLTRCVREQPFCVLLLDEIEKAHPSALNLLLQVFEDGRLTDAAGNVANFSQAVVIMTSNLGASGRARVGFGDRAGEVLRDVDRAVREFFVPELFNRIDRVVPFRPLDPAVARRISEKAVGRLLARPGLAERQVFTLVEPAVIEHVAERGFDARDGARSLHRYLDRTVGALLTEAVAGLPGADMRVLRLHVEADALRLEQHRLQEAEPPGHATSPLERWLEQPTEALRAALPGLLADVEERLASDALAEVAGVITRRVEDFNLGQSPAGHGGTFAYEALRADLAGLRDALLAQTGADAPDEAELLEMQRFGRMKNPRSPWERRSVRVFDSRAFQPEDRWGRAELLGALGERVFLERALPCCEDQPRHSAVVELRVLGDARGGPRFGKGTEGLLHWLTRAYAGERAELEEWVVGPELRGAGRDGLEQALRRAPRRVVLRFSGLCALDVFAAEHGCHVHESLARDPQVVRVQVCSARAEALGEVLPAVDQDAIVDIALPVVRRYRFEPPRSGAAPCVIEDYRLAWVGTQSVQRLEDALALPMLLHRTIDVGEEGSP